MEGAGVYFKASLCGKIYKHFSFLVEEDIRPRDDFKEAEWFLTTVEVNYKFNKYLLAGSGYMSLARYKASDELRNRYYLYATGTYSAGRFTLSVRERFQSTYKVHAEHPKNYLRSMLTARVVSVLLPTPRSSMIREIRCGPIRSVSPQEVITN